MDFRVTLTARCFLRPCPGPQLASICPAGVGGGAQREGPAGGRGLAGRPGGTCRESPVVISKSTFPQGWAWGQWLTGDTGVHLLCSHLTETPRGADTLSSFDRSRKDGSERLSDS